MRPPRAGFSFVVLLLAALTLVADGGPRQDHRHGALGA